MYPWAVSAQCFSQSYFILPKALSSYDHFGMKEGNLTATLWDPFRCVQVKTENSPALPLFSCRSASFSLWGRDRFAVPAVTQAKGCSHLLLPFPQWAVSEGTSQALPLPPAWTDTQGREGWSQVPTQDLWDRFFSPELILEQHSHPNPGQPQTVGGRTRWDENPTTLSSELLSHAAANMWWLFPCLLLAGLQPYSVNFSGKCDEKVNMSSDLVFQAKINLCIFDNWQCIS